MTCKQATRPPKGCTSSVAPLPAGGDIVSNVPLSYLHSMEPRPDDVRRLGIPCESVQCPPATEGNLYRSLLALLLALAPLLLGSSRSSCQAQCSQRQCQGRCTFKAQRWRTQTSPMKSWTFGAAPRVGGAGCARLLGACTGTLAAERQLKNQGIRKHSRATNSRFLQHRGHLAQGMQIAQGVLEAWLQ